MKQINKIQPPFTSVQHGSTIIQRSSNIEQIPHTPARGINTSEAPVKIAGHVRNTIVRVSNTVVRELNNSAGELKNQISLKNKTLTSKI